VDNSEALVDNIFPAQRSDCRGAFFCGKWRICERCARIRAARFADRAQFLAARYGRLALARISPTENTESEMKKLRDRIVRQKLAPAGLWTIETGEQFLRLHLNLLLPDQYTQLCKGAFDYVEPVRSTPRAVAAYITDRRGMPSIQQYSGRLLGEWGSIAQHIMKSTDPQHAPVQAKLIEVTLWHKWHHRGVTHFTQTTEMVEQPDIVPRREKSMLEYGEIARKHLSKLHSIIGKIK
jgi:hypothetical protein